VSGDRNLLNLHPKHLKKEAPIVVEEVGLPNSKPEVEKSISEIIGKVKKPPVNKGNSLATSTSTNYNELMYPQSNNRGRESYKNPKNSAGSRPQVKDLNKE
jgi:hypothetical protein